MTYSDFETFHWSVLMLGIGSIVLSGMALYFAFNADLRGQPPVHQILQCENWSQKNQTENVYYNCETWTLTDKPEGIGFPK